MVAASVLLHANALYSEIPPARLPEVVERSYRPVLAAVLATPGARVALNLSGVTIEALAGERPDLYAGSPALVDAIREGVARGRVEVTGTGWAHAVLPMLPPALVDLDLGLFREAARRVLGVEPRGFFPPELGVDPTLPAALGRHGYAWAVLDRALVGRSRAGHLNAHDAFDAPPTPPGRRAAEAERGGLMARLRWLRSVERAVLGEPDFRPVRWRGAGGAETLGVLADFRWNAYAAVCLARTAFLRERRLFQTLARALGRAEGVVFAYAGDVEFFGFGGNTIREPIPVERLGALLRHLADLPDVDLVLPSEAVGRGGAAEPVYVPAGSWSPDLDFALWEGDADNGRLNRLADRAAARFLDARDRLDPDVRDAVGRAVLLAYNSDGRGWNPLPERRLFCYDRALEAGRMLDRVGA